MKTYRVETISDIFSIPSERRQAFFKELEMTCALHELAFGDAIPAPMNAIVWTDDGNPSISFCEQGGEHLFTLEVTKA